MSTLLRHRFNPVPAHHFTLSQMAKPRGRVGRPTLLTPERRQVVEAAVEAESTIKGVRVSRTLLARALGVSRPTAERWLQRFRDERRARA